MKKVHLLFTFILFVNFLFAQTTTPLPYNTGFDNETEQAGWQAFREGASTFGVWTFSALSPASPPNCLFHDYPVEASETDTTEDWFVSPAFDFSNGAMVSLKINLFSFSGTAWPNDEVSLYLLTGNADPSVATKILLANFNNLATSSQTWTDTNDIIISATPGMSFIGFKYKTTNNWITPRIDDIVISGNNTAVSQPSLEKQIKIYPNPTKYNVYFEYSNNLQVKSISLIDISGSTIKTFKANANMLDVTDIPRGLYNLQINTDKGIINKRLSLF